MSDTTYLHKEATKLEHELRKTKVDANIEIARVIRKLRHALCGKERAVKKLTAKVETTEKDTIDDIRHRVKLLEKQMMEGFS